MDLQRIDRHSGSYDLVICNHVLEHVPDDGAALRELLRIVKSSGVVFLSVPDPCRRARTRDWGFPDQNRHGHYREYGADIAARFHEHLPGAIAARLDLVDEVTATPICAYILAGIRKGLVDHVMARGAAELLTWTPAFREAGGDER